MLCRTASGSCGRQKLHAFSLLPLTTALRATVNPSNHPNLHPIPRPPGKTSSMSSRMASCIFCKIIKGDIPCLKLFESEKTLAFLDIGPLSRGHALVIPKFHGEKLTDIPDDHLTEILPVTKKLVHATEAVEYNILQNNGVGAHQHVPHVHFHMIPKPNADEGLGIGIGWVQQNPGMDKLKVLAEEIKAKM